jgi:hypothetical protein
MDSLLLIATSSMSRNRHRSHCFAIDNARRLQGEEPVPVF